MDRSLYKTLLALGLSTQEIKFFEANFKLGPATINEVAKVARLKRSSAYLVAQQLLDKELLEEDLKNYKKRVFTVDPQKLLRILSAKQRYLRRQELELEESLPELQAIYQKSEIRPKVKVYQGNPGLFQIWKDILSARDGVLIWTNQETETLVFSPDKHFNFINERVKKGIKARVLAVNNPNGKQLRKLDKDNLRETRLLPDETNFTAETYIYDNKVAILDYNQDIIGVIIESQPISSSHKAIFEMTWNTIQ